MKKNWKSYLLAIGSALIVLLFLRACGGDQPDKPDVPIPIIKDAQISSPLNQDQFVVGEDLIVDIEVNNPELVNELSLYIDDTLYQANLPLENQQIVITTDNSRVGYVPIYLEYKDGKGEVHRDNRSVTFFSDISPEIFEVKVVNTYPHNPKSYTQGLEFYKGKLFEGTGQKASSMLAEVDLKTGNHVRVVKLADEIFGEGITIINDTVYQLSYLAGKCFVYDLITFEKIKEFDYAGEGWGLSNNGSELLMSNGSSQIVWRNRHTFEITKKLDVFDDQKNVAQLNELELIGGDLFANMYTDTRICKIDTTTGKILAYYNLALMVNAEPEGADVLNGIAENEGKIYVTGKWWQNLYEVSFE